MTSSRAFAEADLVRGLRDFRRNEDTPHRDAFEVWICDVGASVISMQSMMSDYFEALAKAKP